MSDLFAARSQMAISLGFHIVFAEIGIAMPLLMVLAEWRWRATGDSAYLDLAKRWAKGTAILFAVGAVSGTVLSFELGLLWPRFMQLAGPVIGIPFSLEGFAFFTEAIFLGVYLYGWDRISSRAHLAAGVIVAASGAASAIFVVMVNAFMNTPAGLSLANGKIVSVDPIAGMMNPSSLQQVIHMLLASYAATGLAVAGLHAAVLLKRRDLVFHRNAMSIALMIGVPAAILQPVSGDLSARTVAQWQPIKLAALEGQFETEKGAPLRLGGIPDASAAKTRYAIEIPHGLSLLAFHDPNAEVKGLDAFGRDVWPPIAPVHFGFQLMVSLGTAMALVGVWVVVVVARKREIANERWLLLALAIVAPFGFIATEAGWTVTEVGRQPWVIQGILKTSDAVTPMPGLVVLMVTFTALYVGLGIIVVLLMRTLVQETAWNGAPIGLPEVIAGLIVLALNAYALLAGADFGGGVWDLLASGPRKDEQRELIAESIAPIWEANHVWLIIVVVMLFTAFPSAFSTIGIVLHIPISLLLIGIVLRGSAFVFRSYGSRTKERRRTWGLTFSIASTIAPLLLGAVIGAIASGDVGDVGARVAQAPFTTVFVDPWTSPFAIAVGVFALVMFAFLAAVYSTVAARTEQLREDFRKRALITATIVFVIAALTLVISYNDDRNMSDVLSKTWSLPLHIVTGIAALVAIAGLWARRYGLARIAAALQVSFIIWGWALGQFPFIIPSATTLYADLPDEPMVHLSIRAAAAPRETLELLLAGLIVGAIVLIPSIAYLYRTFTSERAREPSHARVLPLTDQRSHRAE